MFKFTIYYIFTAIIIQLYSLVSKGYYSDFSLFENSVVEYIILTVLYFISFIILDKKKFLIPFIIISIYAILDTVSLIYNRNLDYSYLSNIPLLYDAILHSKGSIVYIILFIILSIILFLIYKFILIRKLLFIYFLIGVFFVCLVTSKLFSDYFIILNEKYATYEKKFWSNDKLYLDAKKTGRLSSFLYDGIIKSKNMEKAKQFQVNQPKELKKIVANLKDKIQKRDLYIVGLESFFIPQRLTNLKLNQKIPIIKNASKHRSSIFGGGTIQSEFEVLCGVPAIQKFSAFELTEFKGASTNCLPTILKELGYSTIFTNSFKPQPSISAASGLGFTDINFPIEYMPNTKTYLTNKNISKGEYAIFDNDLFTQNSNYIKENYQNKPILNYMFSVWGHAFHEMTDPNRLQIIKVINKDKLNLSDHTQRAINQQFYRIKAIKKYLEHIKKVSPDALVVLYSDHLPVLDNKDSYKTYGLKDGLFDNFLLIMDRGKIIKYDKVNLYVVMDIILDRLTDGWYCKNNSCKLDETYDKRYNHIDDYYKIMIPAMKKPSIDSLSVIKLNKSYFFNSYKLHFDGFSDAEEEFRWTSDIKSTISFKYTLTDNNINNLSLNIGTLGKQNITIYLNDNIILNNKNINGDTILNLKLNKSFFSKTGINKIKFKMPNARKAGNGDSRILSVKFKSLKLETN